jgi:peptidylprolyl isomerase
MKKSIIGIIVVVILGVLVGLGLWFMKWAKGADYTGKRVSVDYIGSFPDGKVFDTSIEKVAKDNALYTPNRQYMPLTFTVGGKEVIPGFGIAVNGMKVWATRKVTIEPKDAYWERDEKKITKIDRSLFQQANIVPQVGQTYQMNGQVIEVKEVAEKDVTIDANHPMAGKTLVFEITLKSVDK